MASAAQLTGQSEADVVRSVLYPALESVLAGKAAVSVDSQAFEDIRTSLSQGKTAEEVEFEKTLLAEEAAFWSK